MAFQDLSPIEIDHFKMELKIAYQGMGLNLPNTATLITGFKGNQFFYPKMGTITYRDISPGQQIDAQSATLTRIPGLLKPKGAQILLDDIEESFTNVLMRAPLVNAMTMASGRIQDQVLIDAVTASTDTEITVIPDGGTNLTFEKIQQISQSMNKKAVPQTDRVLLISADADTSLMTDPKVTNNEFFLKGAIARGTFDGVIMLGLTIKIIPDTIENDGTTSGLKRTGDVVTCLAYHKASVGYAKGMSTRISIKEVPLFLDDIVIMSKMTLDSIVVDGRGVFRIGADVTP